MRKELQLRQARKEDTALILSFIRELARDEKLEHEVVADEALLEQWLFERKTAEVIFASWEGKEVGFALYFYNFSTFLGRGGIYLEDLYVKAEYRGRGIGTAMFRRLAAIAQAGLRPSGMVVPGLEPPQHRLLSFAGRRADVGVDRIPHQRQHADAACTGRRGMHPFPARKTIILALRSCYRSVDFV